MVGKWVSDATAAAAGKLAPVVAGALAGAVAARWIAPSDGSRDFFSITAQVLPVLLLALVLEARIFGTARRRFPKREWAARTLEALRVPLEFLTVAALIAGELQAVAALTDPPGARRDPALGYLALGWGFVAIAALAIRGAGRARVTAEVDAVQVPGNAVVRVALGNVYGDKDVQPLVNVLIPEGTRAYRCDRDGVIFDKNRPLGSDSVTEDVCGGREWRYFGERVFLSAGDADVRYYHLSGVEPGAQHPVVVRADHIELPGGRVQGCGTARRPA